MQKPIDGSMTLDEITNAHPDTIAVFNRLGMDICCGGDVTLAEACKRDGVRLEEVVPSLNATPATNGRAA